MERLRLHYTGTIGSSLMVDRFKFWSSSQDLYETVQDWEVKVRQTGNLCGYGDMTDEMCRDKFVFGLHSGNIRTELLKTHLKPNNTLKTMQNVVAEAKDIESAQKTNKIIGEAKKDLETKGLEEQVNWTSHRDMKLKRDPGTCHWCGNQRGPHPWKSCPANGKTCVWRNHYTDLGGGPHIKINQGDQTKDLIENKVRTILVHTVGPLPDTEKIYTIWA